MTVDVTMAIKNLKEVFIGGNVWILKIGYLKMFRMFLSLYFNIISCVVCNLHGKNFSDWLDVRQKTREKDVF